ncbi:Translation initiation factor 3 subunit J component [Tulasnella sp. JGI-2019a]|nr:Translation initiation factor 3 subunit J component [Tulasnella sp. JGI-2019a]
MPTVIQGIQPFSSDSPSGASTAAARTTNKPTIRVRRPKIRPEDEKGEKAKVPVGPRVIAPTKKKGGLARTEEMAREVARLENSQTTRNGIYSHTRRPASTLWVELLIADKRAAAFAELNPLIAAASFARLEALMNIDPTTEDELVDLSKRIINTIFKRLENKPLYATFIEYHIRELARPLQVVDIRNTASGLITLADEKQKEAKDSRKTAKPTLNTMKPGKVDLAIYDESLDDFGQDSDYSK